MKLAFASRLAAVGVPMFLAGAEFADDHDKPTTSPARQTDPVTHDRLSDLWRRDSALPRRGYGMAEVARCLNAEGFRQPKRAQRFTDGMVAGFPARKDGKSVLPGE